MNSRIRMWPFVWFMLIFFSAFLLGAFADGADARKHGLPVPQLWQKYQEFRCVRSNP